ncbi:MAG: MFS transporter [Negativicutes bacterium]|nr:MFS transporter [Negativicutes bacterium]
MNDLAMEKAIMNKVTWRLIPFLVLAYLLCYIDRTNLGFAALTMNKDLGFTATVFGWGAGIFFIGYFFFEVPSNLALQKFGARIWIARIMITWGIISAAMALVSGTVSFVMTRFLLGAAEAGFFPGIVYYLTYWYPERYRANVLARFMFAQPIALMIGSAVSGLVLNMDGVMGVAGWKWLFIIEGIPAVFLGFFTLWYLTEKPVNATWLKPSEREWLQAQITEEHKEIESVRKYTFWESLTHPKVLLLGLVYVSSALCNYGTNMWLPQMVKALGDFSSSQIGLISAIPYVCAAIGMLIIGYSSDHFMERKYHLTGAMVIAGCGLLGSALFTSNAVLTIVCLSVAAIGIFAAIPIFWTLPSRFLTGTASAAGIALINSIGNLGGFVGPFGVGWIKDATGSFANALVCLAIYMLAAAALAYWICGQTEKTKSAASVATGSATPK